MKRFGSILCFLAFIILGSVGWSTNNFLPGIIIRNSFLAPRSLLLSYEEYKRQAHFKLIQRLFSRKKMRKSRALWMLESAHGQHLKEILPRNGKILDLGAGTGFGARGIANLTSSAVTAFEAKALNSIESPQKFVVIKGVRAYLNNPEFFADKANLLEKDDEDYAYRSLEEREELRFMRDFSWVFGETAEELPSAWTDSFDFVLATRLLEYVYDPLRVIEEVYRVLKPGGKASLVSSLVSPKEYQYLVENKKDVTGLNLEGMNLFAEINRLRSLGFQINIFRNVTRRGENRLVRIDGEFLRNFWEKRRSLDAIKRDTFVITLEKAVPHSEFQPLKFNYKVDYAPDVFQRIVSPTRVDIEQKGRKNLRTVKQTLRILQEALGEEYFRELEYSSLLKKTSFLEHALTQIRKQNPRKIMIVGSSIRYLPETLAIMGIKVVFVDRDKDIQADLRQYEFAFFKKHFAQKNIRFVEPTVIYSNIDNIKIGDTALEADSFDMVLLLSIVGPRFKGNVEKALENCVILSAPQGIILLPNTLINPVFHPDLNDLESPCPLDELLTRLYPFCVEAPYFENVDTPVDIIDGDFHVLPGVENATNIAYTVNKSSFGERLKQFVSDRVILIFQTAA